MRTLRTAIAAAILAALTLTATQSTVANGPPQPVEPPLPIELPAGIACPDFALRVSWSGGNVHTKQFVDRDGNPVRTITAGKGFLLTYTNLDAGNSVTIRTDGSVSKTTYNPDGTQTVSATGHNGLILFPTDIPAGPTTTHYIGRIVYNVDPATGVFTLLETSRNQRDICAELAS
jgi:autotransporter passenger strand-loop-strand repeat protein